MTARSSPSTSATPIESGRYRSTSPRRNPATSTGDPDTEVGAPGAAVVLQQATQFAGAAIGDQFVAGKGERGARELAGIGAVAIRAILFIGCAASAGLFALRDRRGQHQRKCECARDAT